MSLRDQLVAKGIVSKKDARRVNQELREQRKQDQGARDRKKHLERARADAEKAEREEALQRRLIERKAREGVREAHELVHRVRQIVLANRLGVRGPIRFFHKRRDTARLGFLQVNEAIGRKLRAGEVSIAELDEGDAASWHVIPRRAAEKLAELEPDRLVFHVTDTAGISAASEAFWPKDWESDIGPHRLADGERWPR